MNREDPGYGPAAARLREMVTLQRSWTDQVNGTNRASRELASGWSRITDIAGGIFTAELGQRIVGWVSGAISKIKEAYQEVEKFRAILTVAFNGNADLASNSLNMLSKFAATTPFQLNEVTAAFIKLVNRGFVPTQQEMIKMGDLASSQGKSFDQYVEALLDAQTGEFERLKEFGIKASKNGDSVTLAFRGVTKEVKNTETAIRNALMSFGEMDGIKGAMEQVSQTVEGLSSNIEDTWQQIFASIGKSNSGLINGFYRAYGGLLSWFKETFLDSAIVDQLESERMALNGLVIAVTKSNDSQLVRNGLITELQTKYPDFLGKLSQEEITTGLLERRLKAVNEQYRDKISLAANSLKITELERKKNDLIGDLGKYEATLSSAIMKSTGKSATDMILMSDKEFDKQVASLKKKFKDTPAEMRKLLGEVLYVNTSDVINGKSTFADAFSFGDGAALTKKKKKELEEVNKELAQYETARVVEEATARENNIKNIDKEIAALKKKKTANSEAEIKRLEESKKAILGIVTPAEIKPPAKSKADTADEKAAVARRKALDAEFKALGLERVADMLSQAQKEVEIVKQKFDKQIEKEQEFLKFKKASKKDLAAAEENIDLLKTQKKQAVIDIEVRQEAEMMVKIKQLRTSLTNQHATELEKQKDQINKFYDEEEARFAGNQDRLATLKKERAIEITNAELREKERLKDEIERIEATGETLQDQNHNQRLAKINKQYDDEIEALRRKFQTEGKLTEEFQKAVDAVNANRTKSLENEEKQKRKQNQEYAIQGAETIAGALATIGANNRKKETDTNLRNLDNQREKELSNKNLTEAQKKEINDRYDAKVKAEKLRAWKADQNAAAKQALISGLLGAAKAMPNFILAALALGTGIVNAAVIKKEPAPVFAKGGLVPRGPDHANGGISLIDNSNGEEIGEMEGGEPIMILSRETARNNRALINELLFNSQYRNGARVSVNADLAGQAIRPFATGGIVQNQNPPLPNIASNNFDTKNLEDKMEKKFDQLIEAWNQGLDINYRYQTEFADKIARIQNSVRG